jgi:hypothetical protein
MRFLWGVNCMWYDRTPTYYHIHDLHALRALALDQDRETAEDLVCRWNALFPQESAISKFEGLPGKAGPGRRNLYIRRATEFLEADLLNQGGRLTFSGTRQGYSIPAFPEA